RDPQPKRRRGAGAIAAVRHALPRGVNRSPTREPMSTTAKRAQFIRQLKALEDDKKRPQDQKKLRPRDKIRIRLRCRLCGRPRAVYGKFGVCRICFRDMASDGLIPGVKKASW